MTTKTFKIWNEHNSSGGGSRTKAKPCFITFTPYGKITFSSGLCEALNLNAQTRITFAEGDDGSFFVCKTKDSGIFFNKLTKKPAYQIGARKLCEHLFEAYGFQKTFRARVNTSAETFPKQEGMPVAGYRIYLNEVKK